MSKNFHDYSIGVSPSELVVKQSLTRNFQKALDNDSVLRDKLVNIDKEINSYTKFNTYKKGDLVYFKTADDSIKLYLLKSKIDNNTFEPTIENGIVKADEHWQIYDTDKEFAVDDIVELSAQNYKAEFNRVHEKDTSLSAHTYGKINDINDLKLLDSTLLNIDQKRVKFLYPYNVRKLTNDNVIQHGYYRKWQNGVIEYDIIFKVGKIGTDSETGFDIIKANNLTILDRNYNNLYFSEKDNNGNFSEFNKIGDQNILVDNVYQQNLLKTMNVFYGEIIFPQPFKDLNYMIFNSNVKNALNEIQQGEYKPLNGAIDYRLIVDGKNLIGHIDDIVDNINSYYLTDIPINSDIINICDDALANLNSPKTDEAPGIEFVIDPNASVLENIGDRAFFNSNVAKIQIPRSVKHIGKDAFRECNRLTDITFDVEEGSPYPRMSRDIFIGCTSLTSININVYPKAANRLLRATSNPLEYYSTLSGDLPLVDRLNKESNYWEAYGLTQESPEPTISVVTDISSETLQTFNSNVFMSFDNVIQPTVVTANKQSISTIPLSSVTTYQQHVKTFTKANSYNKIKELVDNDIFIYEREGKYANIIGIKDTVDKTNISALTLPKTAYDIVDQKHYSVYDVGVLSNSVFDGLNDLIGINLAFNKKCEMTLDYKFFPKNVKDTIKLMHISNARAIKKHTFKDFINLEYLTIDIAGGYIDENLFYNCPKLKTVNIIGYNKSKTFDIVTDNSPMLFGYGLSTQKAKGLTPKTFSNLQGASVYIDNSTARKELKTAVSAKLFSTDIELLADYEQPDTDLDWIVIVDGTTIDRTSGTPPSDSIYYKNRSVNRIDGQAFTNDSIVQLYLNLPKLQYVGESGNYSQRSIIWGCDKLERFIVSPIDTTVVEFRSIFNDIYVEQEIVNANTTRYYNTTEVLYRCETTYLDDTLTYINDGSENIISTTGTNKPSVILSTGISFKNINMLPIDFENDIVPTKKQMVFTIPNYVTNFNDYYTFANNQTQICTLNRSSFDVNGLELIISAAIIPRSVTAIDDHAFDNTEIAGLIVNNYEGRLASGNRGGIAESRIVYMYPADQYDANFLYNPINNALIIREYNGSATEITIPSSYELTSSYLLSGNTTYIMNVLSIDTGALNNSITAVNITHMSRTEVSAMRPRYTNWGLRSGAIIRCSDGTITR